MMIWFRSKELSTFHVTLRYLSTARSACPSDDREFYVDSVMFHLYSASNDRACSVDPGMFLPMHLVTGQVVLTLSCFYLYSAS